MDSLYGECRDSDTDIDRMQSVLLATFLSENILTFADSVAMDSSAELRMPFLDRDLVQFALSLPSSARVSKWPGRANTKLVLRWWGEANLPHDVVARSKGHFPFGNLPELIDTAQQDRAPVGNGNGGVDVEEAEVRQLYHLGATAAGAKGAQNNSQQP